MKNIWAFVIKASSEDDDLIFFFDDEETFNENLEDMKKKYSLNTITHKAEIEDEEYELLKDKINKKIYSITDLLN